jgi:hypothetical protein
VDYRLACAVALCLPLLISCGKSAEPEHASREAAMQRAIADSVAEERAKDQQMRDAAIAEARERLARDTDQFEEARAREASNPEALQAEALRKQADVLRAYTDRLQQFVGAQGALQLRNAVLSPKQNGMCAEFNAKDKTGSYAGFKRVVVTDTAVNPEEPPNRDTLNYFLAFQLAARDTGCFPDVESVHVMR